ncbi:MarR family winged helix-turn-helix transcriptional regulator [Ekhidna sp.]|jgi:DNA-binding MarR family transcriptional regulator|uniref:MarR family winged helix-turn-helix transcriptional regulator n=1 Tax=Ekhidna sp. TaxID=2608089 RepID=UPI0032EAC21B
MANLFDPKVQESDLSSKSVVGLERISEVFRVLLWQKSNETGLSPIQIQLLIFIKNHDSSLANVSQLAREFNMKKPTISDAVKVLFQKELITKESGSDARAYTILLTKKGKLVVDLLKDFGEPVKDILDELDPKEKDALFQALSKVIFKLNQRGLIDVQRTCFGCRFYEKSSNGHYCQFIKKPLLENEIRLDCGDFQQIDS